MSYWIGDILRERREAAGIERSDIAKMLGVHEHTVARLEDGVSMGRDIDRAISAYAYALGIKDGREFWSDALERWYKHGSPPRFKRPDSPAGAFAEALHLTALRRQQDGAGREEKRDATPRKREAG